MVILENKIPKNLEKLIIKSFDNKLDIIVEEIKEVIMAKYDEELVDVVTDRKSKTNPNLYREEFLERLNKFSYIEETDGKVSLIVPDIDNFDFSGRLRVIETIIQGLSGTYVEVNEEDYVSIFNKRPINEDPIDEYVSPKERIYLIRYTPKIRKAEKDLNKDFVRYPFSNTPPIDILSEGDKFVEDNIDKWIEEALEDAQKEFVKNYKGAVL